MTDRPQDAPTPLAAVEEFAAYVRAQENKDLLRFITCGSVDDGKSTLIGRLLYDCKQLFEDQLSALESDSGRFGTTGAGRLDMALLVDGLQAEREQGITIDVAYRFFATDRRKFIVADTPGHEQYTRNMATGASTADLAVLLVDARKGVLTQTRRHSAIAALMGIRHLVVAVNKMDLVGWDQGCFDAIMAEHRAFAAGLGLDGVVGVPVSALTGEGVTRPPEGAVWYDGPTLLQHLEQVPVGRDTASGPLRFPVQWVNRPNQDFRGFSGTVEAGAASPGDPVVVLPSGRTSRIERVVTLDGDLDRAVAGQAVTLVLADEIDVSRGDVIAAAAQPPEVADQFTARLVWMDEQPLLPERTYLLRLGTALVGARVTRLKHRLNINTLDMAAATRLELNDVGLVNLALDRPLPFDPYTASRAMGGFILIDRITNATVACGMIDHGLRRAANLHWQAMKVDRAARATLNGQTPRVLWFTGLSGAGKSTIADAVEQALHARGRRTMSLDGDNIRHGLCRDLGFTDADRVENIRRIVEVAGLMLDAGLIVLISVISPFRNERRMARDRLGDAFLEIHVDTPLEVCEARDVKGLYRKARAGALPNFTGIGSPYEAPDAPDLRLSPVTTPLDVLVGQVLALLGENDKV